MKKKNRDFFSILYRYRYAIGILLLFILVLFKISGSSLALWGQYLGIRGSDLGLLFGTPRSNRADEWATFTPMAFSQFKTFPFPFPYYNNLLRGTLTDVNVIYALPVKDLLILFRPFEAGYLFLGQERGLSFFWCGHLIALFLISYDFVMLISDKKSGLSLAGAFLFTFAPAVQWWFSTNGLPDLLIYSFAFVLALDAYLKENKVIKKVFYTFVLIICTGSYLLVFYPAWQIPFAYILIVFVLWVFTVNRKEFHFRRSVDLPLIASYSAVLVFLVFYFLQKSGMTVKTIMNTVYPGSGGISGNISLTLPLCSLSNVFFPYEYQNLSASRTELSMFIDFSPLGCIMAVKLLFADKKRDGILAGLLGVLILFYCCLIFGSTSMLGKVTLLSHCMASRLLPPITAASLLLYLRAYAMEDRRLKTLPAVMISLAVAAFTIYVNFMNFNSYLSGKIFFLAAGSFAVSFLSFAGSQRLLPPVLIGIVCAAGFFVNPLQAGYGSLFQNDLAQAVEKITEQDPEAIWLTDATGYPMDNYFIMLGAPTVDSVNIYPDMKKWMRISDLKENQDIYNRYAHITVDLTSDHPSAFALAQQDVFHLSLNTSDLKKLNVKYVVSTRDLTVLNTDTTAFREISEALGYRIYLVLIA